MCLRVALLAHVVIFRFFRNLHTVLCRACISLHFHHQWKRVLFFSNKSSLAFIVCRFLDDGHSDLCEVLLHCSFDLHFSDNHDFEHLFMCFLTITCLLWRDVYLYLLSIFWLGYFVFVLCYWAAWSFWRLIPCPLFYLQIFSHALMGFVLFWGSFSVQNLCVRFHFNVKNVSRIKECQCLKKATIDSVILWSTQVLEIFPQTLTKIAMQILPELIIIANIPGSALDNREGLLG